jgi:hypothetical protein
VAPIGKGREKIVFFNVLFCYTKRCTVRGYAVPGPYFVWQGLPERNVWDVGKRVSPTLWCTRIMNVCDILVRS